MEKTIQTTTELNNGVEIPYLGLGTWQARGSTCKEVVAFALTHGYSMIDTAQAYGNESRIGQGWKASGRKREDIFLTTKIRNSNQGYQSSQRSFQQSLENLQTDYVDLLLIHWPDIGDFDRTIETWQAMIEMQNEGLCRSIGVSNFTIPLIERLLEYAKVVPVVNQVEFHTFLYQKELLEFCREKDVQIEAYSPIARARYLENDTLQKITKKYDKTAAQIMLAWCVNHNIVVIPKSVHEGRIQENANIFFDLDDEDMRALDQLGPQRRLVTSLDQPPSW